MARWASVRRAIQSLEQVIHKTIIATHVVGQGLSSYSFICSSFATLKKNKTSNIFNLFICIEITLILFTKFDIK